MTRGQQGPHAPVYETYNGMTGAYSQAVADWPPAPLSQQSQSVFLIIVQCSRNTQVPLLVGSETGQWIEVRPSEVLRLPFSDPNGVYVQGDGGASIVNWMAFT